MGSVRTNENICGQICGQMKNPKNQMSAIRWCNWDGGRSSAGRALDCDSDAS